MVQTVNFFFNGQEYKGHTHITLLDVLNYFGYNLSLLVIEYNNFIYPKGKWKKTYIKNNDIIEIITIVGGG